jgi:hypothetical protein
MRPPPAWVAAVPPYWVDWVRMAAASSGSPACFAAASGLRVKGALWPFDLAGTAAARLSRVDGAVRPGRVP